MKSNAQGTDAPTASYVCYWSLKCPWAKHVLERYAFHCMLHDMGFHCNSVERQVVYSRIGTFVCLSDAWKNDTEHYCKIHYLYFSCTHVNEMETVYCMLNKTMEYHRIIYM